MKEKLTADLIAAALTYAKDKHRSAEFRAVGGARFIQSASEERTEEYEGSRVTPSHKAWLEKWDSIAEGIAVAEIALKRAALAFGASEFPVPESEMPSV